MEKMIEEMEKEGTVVSWGENGVRIIGVEGAWIRCNQQGREGTKMWRTRHHVVTIDPQFLQLLFTQVRGMCS